MKKSVSLSRICLVVCIIILLATAIVTSPFGSLLPVFGFVALLAVIPLVRGNRTQKIVAAVILAIAATLFIFAIEDFKFQRQRMERIRKQTSHNGYLPLRNPIQVFDHISAWRFGRPIL
jgi:O-antigen ligase